MKDLYVLRNLTLLCREIINYMEYQMMPNAYGMQRINRSPSHIESKKEGIKGKKKDVSFVRRKF